MNTSSPQVIAKMKTVGRESLHQLWNRERPNLTLTEQDKHIEALVDILVRNWYSGRLHHATGGERNSEQGVSDSTLHTYGGRVARYYWKEHERINRLREGDKEHWEELCHLLEVRAFKKLHYHSNHPPSLCQEQAKDYAQEACQRIFDNHYPYDVPFIAWANRILIHCILQHLQRSPDLLDRGCFVEAESDAPVLGLLGGYSFPRYSAFESLDWKLLLTEAIGQLSSEAQRKVILLDFFYGWEDGEIAEALDRSRQAVHNLRHRALRGLRQILEQEAATSN